MKSCESEQLTDGLETQLSMNSGKVTVKEAACSLADLPGSQENGPVVFI